MAIVGDPGLWSDTFPEGLVPDILNLVVTTWTNFAKPSQGDTEVTITKNFRQSLISAKLLRRLPLRIDRESVEDDLESGEEKGRIDLKFTASNSANEKAYFAIECKRLHVTKNGKFASLAGLYVNEGMMRFVTSQYSRHQSFGGMIGYVLDGKLNLAIKRIERAIQRRHIQLASDNSHGLKPSSAHPTAFNIRETYHQLERGTFTIHHIFLSCLLSGAASPT